MKTILLFAVAVSCASAAPQTVNREDVEFVPAVNTNQGDPETTLGGGGSFGGSDGFPVIIVRTRGGSGGNGNHPFGSLFPFLNLGGIFGHGGVDSKSGDDGASVESDEDDDDDFFAPNFGVIPPPSEDGDDDEDPADTDFFPPGFFGPVIVETDEDDGSTSSRPKCGMICTLLRGLSKEVKKIEENVKEIRRKQQDKQNEVDIIVEDGGNGDGPIRNSTYTEEVLPDGTIVKINKTTIHHDSPDGFGSFFSSVLSTSYHPVDDFEKEVEEEEKESEITPDEVETSFEEDEEEETPKIDVRTTDDFINDIFGSENDDEGDNDENVGVDTGLLDA